MIITQQPDTTEHFAAQVTDALTGMKQDQAVQFIAKLHAADVDALQDRLTAAQDETAELVATSTQSHYLVDGLAAAVAREVLRAAQLQARNKLCVDLLDALGALARQSESGTVPADLILRTLARPLPKIPFRPHVAAFHPDSKYRYGHFAADEGDVTLVFPFVGWSVVVMHPDAAQDRLYPTFLVDGETYPEPTIALDRGVKLRKLT